MNEKDNKNSERSGLYFSIFAVLLLVLFLLLGLYLVRQRTFIKPRASNFDNFNTGFPIDSVSENISLENSYVFASPVRARVGGEKIRITVFILDSEGKGVSDKTVSLSNKDDTLDISEIQNLTNDTGMAIFDVSSLKAGNYYLEVLVEGKVLLQKARVIFD